MCVYVNVTHTRTHTHTHSHSHSHSLLTHSHSHPHSHTLTLTLCACIQFIKYMCVCIGYHYISLSHSRSLCVSLSLSLSLSCVRMPKTEEPVRLPTSIQDVKQLYKQLSAYSEHHFTYIALVFGYVYLIKQCFSIPGSVFLNLIAGALFGVQIGFPLVCVLTGECVCVGR